MGVFIDLISGFFSLPLIYKPEAVDENLSASTLLQSPNKGRNEFTYRSILFRIFTCISISQPVLSYHLAIIYPDDDRYLSGNTVSQTHSGLIQIFWMSPSNRGQQFFYKLLFYNMTSIQQGKSRHGQTIKAVFVFRVFNCIQQ